MLNNKAQKDYIVKTFPNSCEWCIFKKNLTLKKTITVSIHTLLLSVHWSQNFRRGMPFFHSSSFCINTICDMLFDNLKLVLPLTQQNQYLWHKITEAVSGREHTEILRNSQPKVLSCLLTGVSPPVKKGEDNELLCEIFPNLQMGISAWEPDIFYYN